MRVGRREKAEERRPRGNRSPLTALPVEPSYGIATFTEICRDFAQARGNNNRLEYLTSQRASYGVLSVPGASHDDRTLHTMLALKHRLHRAPIPLNKRAGFLYPLRPFRRRSRPGSRKSQAKHQAPRGACVSPATILPCHNSVTHVQESDCTMWRTQRKMHVTG